jgi:hypothetical protein
VVAASRARLGFFIVGSAAAVEKGGGGSVVKHWASLLEHLGQPRDLDPAECLGRRSNQGDGGLGHAASPDTGLLDGNDSDTESEDIDEAEAEARLANQVASTHVSSPSFCLLVP